MFSPGSVCGFSLGSLRFVFMVGQSVSRIGSTSLLKVRLTLLTAQWNNVFCCVILVTKTIDRCLGSHRLSCCRKSLVPLASWGGGSAKRSSWKSLKNILLLQATQMLPSPHPPLALLSQSVYMNILIKYLNFICFVLLMGELKKYSDKLEKVLLHKNEKLSMWWFCDIVPQLQSLGERSNCSHSNKRSLMKVF